MGWISCLLRIFWSMKTLQFDCQYIYIFVVDRRATIDGREVMGEGGEGTSANETNVGRDWLSATDMKFNEGVVVGL